MFNYAAKAAAARTTASPGAITSAPPFIGVMVGIDPERVGETSSLAPRRADLQVSCVGTGV